MVSPSGKMPGTIQFGCGKSAHRISRSEIVDGDRLSLIFSSKISVINVPPTMDFIFVRDLQKKDIVKLFIDL
jgi:hypothetical protein